MSDIKAKCVRVRVRAPIPLSSVMTGSFHPGWRGLPVPSFTGLEGWSVSLCVCVLPYTHIDSPLSNQTEKKSCPEDY